MQKPPRPVIPLGSHGQATDGRRRFAVVITAHRRLAADEECGSLDAPAEPDQGVHGAW